MRILITAGPTREYLDSVRFLSNGSTGLMGYSIAQQAVKNGHDVTLLSGSVALEAPAECKIARFVSVADLQMSLAEHFDRCDVLVMCAAVGDFRPEKTLETKISRKAGPIEITLIPTPDVVANIAQMKRSDQRIIAFAVEDSPPEQAIAGGRAKLANKGADFIVINPPAAIAADKTTACMISPHEMTLPWRSRSKQQLASEIITVIETRLFTESENTKKTQKPTPSERKNPEW